MSEKRRDNKNRILRENELQKPDGRYEYRYIGTDGARRSVYSWRLTTTDKTPPGKRDKPPLRKLEEEINKDLMDGLAVLADNLTVYELCEKYIFTKINVTKNTQANYKTVLNVLRKHPFGKRKINTVRTMEAKEFLIRLQQDDHRGYSSIHNIRGVLRPAFQMATENDLFRKNPFEFQLADTLINDSVKRQAVSKKQMRQFLDFVKQEYNNIYRVQLPKITPHVCRHTYSTIMAVTRISPKTLQYLMGHSDISVTLNVYTHIGYEDAVNELKRLNTGTYVFYDSETLSGKMVNSKMFYHYIYHN